MVTVVFYGINVDGTPVAEAAEVRDYFHFDEQRHWFAVHNVIQGEIRSEFREGGVEDLRGYAASKKMLQNLCSL